MWIGASKFLYTRMCSSMCMSGCDWLPVCVWDSWCRRGWEGTRACVTSCAWLHKCLWRMELVCYFVRFCDYSNESVKVSERVGARRGVVVYESESMCVHGSERRGTCVTSCACGYLRACVMGCCTSHMLIYPSGCHTLSQECHVFTKPTPPPLVRPRRGQDL
jgi:hypothetical protein